MKQPTLQTQYNLITEGKGNKFAFLREAKTKFPGYVPNSANFDQAVNILKTKNILNENYVDLKPINSWDRKEESYETAFKNFLKEEETKVKANSKKVAKEVEETQDSNYSNDDVKNLDNQIGQEVFNGIAFEARKHPDKTLDEIRAIVSKNLAKDKLYYLKNAAFGIEGIGYTEDVPGFKSSKSDQMQKVKLNENRPFISSYKSTQSTEKWSFTKYFEKAEELVDKISQWYEQNKPEKLNQVDADLDNLLARMQGPDMDLDYWEFRKLIYPKYKEALIDPNKKTVELYESKKPSMDDHLNKIQKAGEMVTLEAKINAIDEAIKKRQDRIDMIGENEDLAELVHPAKLKEFQKEIKLLEKQKDKLEKLYEKMTGKKKQEVVGETEVEPEELNEIFGLSKKEKDLKLLKQKIDKAVEEINKYNFNSLFFQSDVDNRQKINLIRKRQAAEELPTYFELIPELLDDNNRIYNGIINARYKLPNGSTANGFIPAIFNNITDEQGIISNEKGKHAAKNILFKKYPNVEVEPEELNEGIENTPPKKLLEKIFNDFIINNNVYLDTNEIETYSFEQIFEDELDQFDQDEHIKKLKSFKLNLIEYLIDNKDEKIEVSSTYNYDYFYIPYIKDNTIYIDFVPINYNEDDYEEFKNPKNIKIDTFPLEINGYEFYGYYNYNPKIYLGKGENVVEFQSVKLPNESGRHSLWNFNKDAIPYKKMLENYLKKNNIPFIFSDDSERGYIQVPLTYVK